MISGTSIIWLFLLLVAMMMSLGFVLRPNSMLLRFSLLHGGRIDINIYRAFNKFYISNRIFTLFYVVGSVNMVLSIYSLMILRDNPHLYDMLPYHVPNYPNATTYFIISFLLLIHINIRLYECLFVTHFGSYITLTHLVWGLFYYTIVPLTMFTICPRVTKDLSVLKYLNSHQYIWSIHFIFCCLLQNQLHRILAKSKNLDGTYSQINIGLFRYMSCPHYLMESGCYFCLAMILWNSLELWLVFLTTTLFLMVSARSTHKLHKSQYKDYPKWAMIPFVF